MDINRAIISGHVKGEPKIFNGGVASFTVAVYNGKNKDGESLGYDYIDCKAFKGTAEYISQYVNDGDYIVVEGKNSKSNYINKNGDKVYTQEIRAMNVKAVQQNNNQNYQNNQNNNYRPQNNYQNKAWG